MTSNYATYTIVFVAMCGVVARPWRSSEALWSVAGAASLVVAGLLPFSEAASAIARGADVYMFLTGMMLLSELARREGLFDYVAALCVLRARGSARRLFLLVYGVGTLVTIFMSNDATAVVLTPAVLAVCRKAKAKPLPYLLGCAFIANAASFVLPISNPANLVIFGERLPSLAHWVDRFLVPSLFAIGATYLVFKAFFRVDLMHRVTRDIEIPALSAAGKLAAMGVVSTASVLLGASALGWPLGMSTLWTAGSACMAISIRKRESPWSLIQHVSWSVLALVAGLFVLVQSLERAGLLKALTELMQTTAAASPVGAAVAAGMGIALASNLTNNLPAGLLAGSVVAAAAVDPLIQSAVAIGVDLGPNLSVTGSLATILWLAAIRREGEVVSAWQFLRVGAIAMPVALVFALLALLLQDAIAR